MTPSNPNKPGPIVFQKGSHTFIRSPGVQVSIDDVPLIERKRLYANMCGIVWKGKQEQPKLPRKQPIPRPDNALLTIKEVAARLQVSGKQVRKFVDNGSLRYINVGRGSKYRTMRFAPADVDECLRELTKRESPAIKQPTKQRTGRRNTEDAQVIGFTAMRNRRGKA